MPDLFIITGPNGAGKSSNSKKLLPDNYDLEVFDGDKIFYQLLDKYYMELKVSKYAREKAGEELQIIFKSQIDKAIRHNLNYAYEGHFSNPNSWETIKKFRDNAYKINMIFVALESIELSLQRVALRVYQGGHHVPPPHIYENYFGNLALLDINYNLIDNLIILDNSTYKSIHLLTMENFRVQYITKDTLPTWLKQGLPKLLSFLKLNRD